MKKVKLRVSVEFDDVQAQTKRLKNSEFECSENRAKEILAHKSKLAEIIGIKKEEYGTISK